MTGNEGDTTLAYRTRARGHGTRARGAARNRWRGIAHGRRRQRHTGVSQPYESKPKNDSDNQHCNRQYCCCTTLDQNTTRDSDARCREERLGLIVGCFRAVLCGLRRSQLDGCPRLNGSVRRCVGAASSGSGSLCRPGDAPNDKRIANHLLD